MKLSLTDKSSPRKFSVCSETGFILLCICLVEPAFLLRKYLTSSAAQSQPDSHVTVINRHTESDCNHFPADFIYRVEIPFS